MLYTETTVELNIQFTAKKIIQRGQAAINATFYGYSFRLGLYNDSLCAYTQPGCPIQADGTVYTYTYAVYISPSFIPMPMGIRWTLSSNNETLACADFQIRIVNAIPTVNRVPPVAAA
ncbi:unnamed protein product [Dicrocoelium dendriticum]|nr:unnamed protein product [Dicrocoelium dendriticum]